MEYEECEYYDLPYNNFTDDQILDWQWDADNPYKRNETDILDCDQWVYDQSTFISTAVTEVHWHFLCRIFENISFWKRNTQNSFPLVCSMI